MKKSKKEEIKERFLERINNNKPITYKLLKEQDSPLLYAIERHFGSISKICKEVGITEDDMIKKYGFSRNINKKTLNEQEIHDRLIYLKSIGKLTTSAMRTEFDDLRLEISIKKLFGSVEKGLRHFGLERDSKVVTKKGLLNKIYEYKNQGVDLYYSNMIEVDSALVSNSTKKFNKGWNELITSLNIDFTPKRIPFSKDSIKERLDFLYGKFGEVNNAIIKEHDSSILYYANTNFDRLEDFYQAMGYDPLECMDFDTQKSKGRQFELLFVEVLDALNIPHLHNRYYNNKIRPDFQLNDKVWVDCKLSSWTSTIDSTIEKYTEHCDKLIIVYLRGNKVYSQYKDKNEVEFRKIDYYFSHLEKINRHDLIEKFNRLLNNSSESVTTERSIS